MSKSKVEEWFIKTNSDNKLLNKEKCLLKPIITDNYVSLGQLTALRFLEWVCENPGGVIALPTGKTPEFFIKWTQFYLENWKREMNNGILAKIGLNPKLVPDMKSLTFFQLDEFFPIHPEHERSFMKFIKLFYIKGFGLDEKKAHLINTCDVEGNSRINLCHLFEDGEIDLSLRTRQVKTERELNKKMAIQYIDQKCAEYEEAIHNAGGIGFFLGGIGPDGHIAFNIRGSRHDSLTRLDHINYETQAAAASDLGGIENVRRKAVVTIGLHTITANPDCTAIIIAAGASKSNVVADAILQEPSPTYPATSLQKLKNARMFITRSATLGLIKPVFPASETSAKAVKEKIQRGLSLPIGKKIMHTAPDHDDIELAYFPAVHHLVRSDKNENYFVYCTSGFTSVTNIYLGSILEAAGAFLNNGDIQKIADEIKLFDIKAGNHDITGYLNGIAQRKKEKQLLYVATRLLRNVASHLKTKSLAKVKDYAASLYNTILGLEPGSKEPSEIQLAKGWVREFEAELAWAHFGLPNSYTYHMRLKFYSADIFPEYPNYEEDILPIYRLINEINPDIITLALDPEGSGPDTHYKTLMAVSAAIDLYVEKTKRKDLRVWGYRNVWSQFMLGEVNTIIPVSLNSLAVLHNMFDTCFLSQRTASFPSYEYDGPFSEVAQIRWVNQFNEIREIVGDEHFYSESASRMLNRTYGAIYLKDMSYDEFSKYLVSLRRLLECKSLLG